MSAIYLKVLQPTQFGAPSILYYLTVKMGYIADSNFHNYPKPDTFKTGLSVVYSKDTTVLLYTDSVGKWIRIPLNPYSFTYYGVGDTAKKDSMPPRKYFVVEFSSQLALSKSTMIASLTCPRNGGVLGGTTTQTTSKTTSGNLYDFGFDIGPPVSTNVAPVVSGQLLAMYPNPATDWLHISGIKGAVNYSINDNTGRMLRSEPMPSFNAVSLHDLPPGMYILRIWGTDQQPQTLQFVKQ
jgi:hypothetical protein